jgi:hypothetical protein
LGDEARPCALLATRGADETFRPRCDAQLSLSPEATGSSRPRVPSVERGTSKMGREDESRFRMAA